jgi:beta-glucosidase
MFESFDRAVDAINSGECVSSAAEGLVDSMTEDEILWILDGDAPTWEGLGYLAQGGYHKAPFGAAVIDRLNLPGVLFADGPRGCVIGNSTCFPVAVARGATWNEELEERVGEAIGKELKAAGATLTGAICVNLIRHPKWGRAQESYGEDPFHVGEMGAAVCRGLQKYVMASVKHLACNSMENARFSVDITADETILHEVYLPQFKRVVEEGVASVMSAYNSLNGEWCGQNSALLSGVLRDEWGFKGFVISDWIFGIRDSAKSIEAGLNIEMPYRMIRMTHLKDELATNEINFETVKKLAVQTVAGILLHAEILTKPKPPISVIGCDEHRQLARQVASNSAVLLKNESDGLNPVLPLTPGNLSLGVFGHLAAKVNLGDGGSSDVWDLDCTTILEGIRQKVPSVKFNDGTDLLAAEELASSVDTAIVVVGYTYQDEGEYIGSIDPSLSELLPGKDEADVVENWKRFIEGQIETVVPGHLSDRPGGFAAGGDRDSLLLHNADVDLIKSVVKVNQRTIVVIQSGGAVIMSPWIDGVPSVLQAFYGGCRAGEGLADVIFGDVNPSAKLPYTICTEVDDYPVFDKNAKEFIYDGSHGWWHLIKTDTSPAFSFGFGLSYTSFEVSGAEIEKLSDYSITITGNIKNTGSADGAEVLQVYVEIPDRFPRLVGFKRVEIESGEKKDFKIEISTERLATRNKDTHSWNHPQGTYEFSLKRYATDPDAQVLRIEL